MLSYHISSVQVVKECTLLYHFPFEFLPKSLRISKIKFINTERFYVYKHRHKEYMVPMSLVSHQSILFHKVGFLLELHYLGSRGCVGSCWRCCGELEDGAATCFTAISVELLCLHLMSKLITSCYISIVITLKLKTQNIFWTHYKWMPSANNVSSMSTS